MKIPISIFANENDMFIYRNGGCEIVKLPFKPYILVESSILDIKPNTEKWIKIPENIKTDYTKFEFQSIPEQLKIKKEYPREYTYYNNYNEQLFIQNPDFLYKYPNNNPLKILYYDIETATKGDGFFSKPITNPILMIGYSTWVLEKGKPAKKTSQKIIDTYNDTDEDINILNEFFNDIHEFNPDVIADFNGLFFDFPYLLDRSAIKKIDTTRISRTNSTPYKSDYGDIVIPGRIHFDIYNSNAGVIKDQGFFGIKSKSLKEIARFFKIDIEDVEVQEDIANLYSLWQRDRTKLVSYQRDDVLRTEFVGNIYLRNCITLAEILGVPLKNIITMHSSFVPKIVTARNMYRNKLINTRTNFQKYNSVNGSIYKFQQKDKKELKHEGALVGLYKSGYFPQVYKVDFSSFYPSCIQTFNLGPDTTTLVKVDKYTGIYKFNQDSKYNWYTIPDKNFQVDITIKVKNDQEGFTKKDLTKFRLERTKLKNERKNHKHDSAKYEELTSQQMAIKIILNTTYGLMSTKTTTYGDMISGLAVTGLCRWVSSQTMQLLKNQLVEVDTDGYLVDSSVDVDYINNYLNKLISDTFKISDNYFQLELEEFGRAYFYKSKNYVVQEGNRYIIHGSSLKSSKACKVIDRAVNLAIEHVFNNKPVEEVLREAYDFSNCGFEDFEERQKISKDLPDYDDQASKAIFLAKQMELKTKQACTEGTQVNYVVTKKPLPFEEFKQFYEKKTGKYYTFTKYTNYNKDELDLNYYIDLIDKVLERFNIRKVEQLDLFGTQIRKLNKI